MLYFDRIDLPERIDVNKTNQSEDCNICLYWYFLNNRFKFQSNICNRCHDLLMMSMNLSGISISNSKGADHRLLITKNFSKLKQKLMVMNLKIFMRKEFLRWTLIILAQLLLAWILLIIKVEIII